MQSRFIFLTLCVQFMSSWQIYVKMGGNELHFCSTILLDCKYTHRQVIAWFKEQSWQLNRCASWKRHAKCSCVALCEAKNVHLPEETIPGDKKKKGINPSNGKNTSDKHLCLFWGHKKEEVVVGCLLAIRMFLLLSGNEACGLFWHSKHQLWRFFEREFNAITLKRADSVIPLWHLFQLAAIQWREKKKKGPPLIFF